MSIVFSNNATSKLATNVNAAQTTITLEPGGGMSFPNITDGNWSPLVLFNNMGELEIMHATHKAGDSFTVRRGEEGTAARPFYAGDQVHNRISAQSLAEIQDTIDGKPSKEQVQQQFELAAQLVPSYSTIGRTQVAIRADNVLERGVYANRGAISGCPSASGVLIVSHFSETDIEQRYIDYSDNANMVSMRMKTGSHNWTDWEKMIRASDLEKRLTALEASLSEPMTGAVMAFAMENEPPGWLECNGRAVPIADYSRLFGRIGHRYGGGPTHFNLPDYRGEFLRGWDRGRGADPGRAFATFQPMGIQSHDHEIGGLIEHRMSIHDIAVAVWDHRHGSDGRKRTLPAGGNETRPRNVAVMYCIKV